MRPGLGQTYTLEYLQATRLPRHFTTRNDVYDADFNKI